MRLSLFLSLAALPLLLGIPAAVAPPGGNALPGDREEPRDDPAGRDGTGDEKPHHDRAELEETFRKTMNRATLEGKWRLVKDGELGEERTEKYSLGEVKKIEDDRWLIEARVQFGEKDVRVPVPVRVLWAGDTPIITVTDLWLPGLGTYTARVLIYNGLYTGTWFGAGYGGLMSGRVVEDDGARGGAESGAKGEAEDELETGSGRDGNGRGGSAEQA